MMLCITRNTLKPYNSRSNSNLTVIKYKLLTYTIIYNPHICRLYNLYNKNFGFTVKQT